MKIETQYGKPFKIVRQSPIVGPTTDMEAIEYWEGRLKTLDVPFAVCYKEKLGQIYYFIFVKGGKLT